MTMISLEVLTLASWEIGKALVQVFMSQVRPIARAPKVTVC